LTPESGGSGDDIINRRLPVTASRSPQRQVQFYEFEPGLVAIRDDAHSASDRCVLSLDGCDLDEVPHAVLNFP
jgi:hypothetical protein